MAEAGSGGADGAAGSGGTGGGSGGEAGLSWGEGGWIMGREHWKDVHFEGESNAHVISEADLDELTFKSVGWGSGCGSHCELVEDFGIEDGFGGGDTFLGTAKGDDGPSVVMMGLQNSRGLEPIHVALWRVFDLSNFYTLGVLRKVKFDEAGRSVFIKGKSPNYIAISTGSFWLRGALDLESGGWEWKAPYTDGFWGGICDWLAVGSSPPALIDSCLGGIAIYDKPGSIEPVSVSSRKTNWFGASYGSRAVWTQLPSGSTESHVWSWTREEGERLVATIPGNLCGIHTSESWIVGSVGHEPLTGGLCDDALHDQQFFKMKADGTELAKSPVFPFPIGLSVSAATDDFMAIYGTSRTESVYERHYLLVRLSDWKIRRFHARPERNVDHQHLALDREYFYFADYHFFPSEKYDLQLRRYPLAEFDSIGEEFVPW